ncbi:MAG: flagellar hook-length control protein FliK, partial [Stellaceae bacterium]
AAQAAALVASLASPAANGTPAPVPAGAGRAATVGAAVSISSATGGSQNARAMIPSLLARGAGMPSDHELVGPEDGTGSQEPDGSDPATAMVGRPAAMASAGLDAALAVVPSAPNSVSTAADTASASASGSLDNQPAVPTVTGTASSTTASAPTLVLAALASSERDPSRTPPANGGDGTTLGTVSTITTPLGVTIANVLPSAAPGASIAANNNINVVTADGSSQPLATALSSQMLTMVAAGRNQVTVHLSPPDLGTLTVHVEVQSRDVSAWFASPQPQVQQAVNDALAQLHGSLSGAGLNLASAWVGADVSGGGNGRPTATPLPIRRAPAAPGRADANVAGATSVEGLSVYA